MNRISHRRTRTGARRRSVTRLHVEGLEARLAAGTVVDLFGSNWAGLGVFGPPGGVLPSAVETADTAAGQRHAPVTQRSNSPVGSLLFTLTTPKSSDGHRSSSGAVSPISSRESSIVVDPRWGGPQGPAEAAWDRMGTPDAPLHGTTPTGPLALHPGSAASGGAGNRFGNPGKGTPTAGSGGFAAGGGGTSAMAASGAGVSGAARAVPRPGPLTSSAPASAGTVVPSAGVVAGASSAGAAVAAQVVAGHQPATSVQASPVVGGAGSIVLEPSSFSKVTPAAQSAIGQVLPPITFLENRDPGDAAVKFVASNDSITASFEEHAIGLQLGGQPRDLVRLEVQGASAKSRLVGDGAASGPNNVGTNGATFSGVRYTGLYDGIDMRVDDSGGELEYELFVAPGADVATALMHADGGVVTVNADGSLTIQAPGGTLHQTAPVSWDVLPDGSKRPLESQFRVDSQGDYGFDVVGHDPTLPLVIDPTIVPAPTTLSPANGASVTEPFNISWSSVTSNPSGVTGYNWEVSTTSTFTSIAYLHAVNSPTTQDVVSGLAAGTYFWRVQAVDGAFDPATWSATQSFTVTGVNANSPGTSVLATTEAYSTFHPFETGTTSWTPVSGATTYVFETSQDPNFAWDKTFTYDNLTKTTLTFTIGFEGTFYSRVYAVSADGVRGVPSNAISYTYFLNNPIGPAPGLVSPISGQTVTLPVTLQWANVPDPQTFGYDVEVATDPAFKNIEDTEVQESFPFVIIDSLTPGTKYWRVFSDQGASAFATPDSAGLPAVTAPSATGTFTVSTAPPTPLSLAFQGFPFPQVVPGGTNFYQMALQLTTAAPAAGAAIALTSSNPTVAPVPASITMAGFAWGGMQMTLAEVKVPTPVTITATLNGVSTTAQFTVQPPTLTSIQVSAPQIGSGSPVALSVNLQGPAPASGAVVSLSSNSPAVIVPPTMTVPAAFWSGSVLFTAASVSAATDATITATYNGISQQTMILVTPPRPPASVTIDPNSRIGSDPGSTNGVVNIASFSSDDQTFQLTSSNPAVASVPATMTVTAGSLGGGFSITTSAVAATTVVTITATGNGVKQSALFTVYPTGTKPSLSSVTLISPAVMGGTATTGTVELNSTAPAGGLVVPLTSSSPVVTVPASVTVPAGANSVTFTVNTTAVTTSTSATITGTLGTKQSTTLTVTPSAPPSLYSLSLTTQNVFAGASVTGRVALSAAALTGGAVVTLTSDSPAVTVPASVTIAADAVAVMFPVTTSAVPATTAVYITASFGGNSQSIRLNVSPPQSGPVLAGLTVTPTSIPGLTTATATLTLSAPAPAGGAAVFVTHDSLAIDQNLLGINVMVPAGATSATFTVSTYKVSAPMVASISASYGGVTQNAVVTVTPTAAAVTVSTVSLNPASVTGGTSSTGIVTLTAAAHAGGMVVTLASNNTAAATVPATVTVAAGATTATFTVTTKAVTASTAVAISAAAGGVTKSATLTVNPASADTVGITKAEYTASKSVLMVEATSTSSSATLQVFQTSTNQLIGTLTNNGGGKYTGQSSWPTNPQNITVKSSLGGSSSKAVMLK
jgi:hypothetical protein